jgi:exopolysaccharide biosynthesis polyprenyl glycosylphosphotransferase
VSDTRTLIASRPMRYGQWIHAGYVITDLVLVVCISSAVFFLRFLPDWGYLFGATLPRRVFEYPPLNPYLGFLVVWAALILLMCQEQDLYRTARTQSALDEALAVVRAVGFAAVLLTIFIFLTNVQSISRLVVAGSAILNLIALGAWRYWKRRIIVRRVVEGHGVRNVLIVGADQPGQEFANHLDKNKYYGFLVKGFLDTNHVGDPRVLGKIEDFSTIAREWFIDEVFITIPSDRKMVKDIVIEAQRLRLGVKVVPDLYDGLIRRAPLEYLGEFAVMSLHGEPIPVLGLFVKRIMDVMISFVGLVLTLPALVGIAIAVKLDSPGPVFYCAPRKGKKGREFICYKFRTMVDHAEALKEDLRPWSEREGPVFKMRNDPRVTRVGKFLRRSSLDELPQLINIFRGEMSLVGPRPHSVEDFRNYALEHFKRMDVMPGLTGLWQTSARQDPSFDTLMALDLKYIETWNLWLDIKVLLKTIPAVLKGSGE